MATTDLTKLIIPPVFTQWVIDRLDDSNNLLKSGILTPNTGIDLQAPGVTVEVPYIKAEKHLPMQWTDQEDKQSYSLGSGSMRGMKFYQTLTYSSTKLSRIISGAPTAEAIGQAMLDDWTAGDMKALLSLLKGIFGVPDIKDAKSIDMTEVSPTNSDFNSAGWLAARTLMGDKANVLTGIAVNSATEAMMTQEDLKDHGSQVSSQVAPYGTFHGMIITVDDQIPIDLSDPKKPKSTAYIFAQNAVSFNRDIISTDTDKDTLKKGGMSWVTQDSIGAMNVQGTALKQDWTPANYPYAKIEELTSSDAWEVPEGRSVRNIGVVSYTHTVDPIFAQGLIAAKKKADAAAAKETGDTTKVKQGQGSTSAKKSEG